MSFLFKSGQLTGSAPESCLRIGRCATQHTCHRQTLPGPNRTSQINAQGRTTKTPQRQCASDSLTLAVLERVLTHRHTCIGPKLLGKAFLTGRKVGTPVADAGVAWPMVRAVQGSCSCQSRRHLGCHAAAVLGSRASGVVRRLHACTDI